MAVRAGAQPDLDLNRRVPPAVEDLAGVDSLDLAHASGPSVTGMPDPTYFLVGVTGTLVVCGGVLVCGVAVPAPVESPAGVLGALYCLQSVTT